MLSQDIMKYGDKKSRFYVDKQGAAMIVRCAFSRFAGEVEPSPYLRIALNLGGGGSIKEIKNNVETRRDWRKGSIYLGLGEPCQMDCPAVEILSIVIDLEDWCNKGICSYRKSDFAKVVNNPPSDKFISTMLKALWESASLYGVETDFFRAGTLQILDRLATKPVTANNKKDSKVIPEVAFAMLDTFIDKQIDQRITIAELAASINMEEARFAKAFTHFKGQTPFAYITSKRMVKAKTLLASGYDITSTATSVGYSNPSKFAAAFRRYTGKSPSEWKRIEISE